MIKSQDIEAIIKYVDAAIAHSRACMEGRDTFEKQEMEAAKDELMKCADSV